MSHSVWLAILLVACSGEATPSTVTSSGSGAAPPEEPAVHRPMATSCTGEPKEGNAIPTSGECMTDAECTAGTNGRCIWPFGGDNVCMYDECTSDADCGVGVCACRVEASFDFNRCFQGNCVIDSDCGTNGYCSPSGVDVFPNCMTDLSPGSIGFFCHTSADECTDNADCGDPSSRCIFSAEAGHWTCFSLLCTQ